MADVVYQMGLLSTPFHRVYFEGAEEARVEILPGNRLKIPFGVRLSYYLHDMLKTRLYYRYYYDDFGNDAHTFELELSISITKAVALTSFYRYHRQEASDYFQKIGEHNLNAQYYTSDYDLSAFHSNKIGLGLRYYPLWGIARFKPPLFPKGVHIKRTDLRISTYDRSDGLQAYSLSWGFSFFFD